MIRIIFDNGEVADCEHIEKMYVEQYEMDKVTVVGRLEDEDDVRKSDRGVEESNTDNRSEVTINR